MNSKLPQPSRPTFRPIETTDIPDLFRVRIATWHNAYGARELEQLGITHESVEQLLESSHQGWLCEIDSHVVGFAMGNRKTGEMWVIAVLSEFEDQGIGRWLLTSVEDWLFEKGWDEIWLTTDPEDDYRAVGFYKHLGWHDWKFESGDRFMKKVRPA